MLLLAGLVALAAPGHGGHPARACGAGHCGQRSRTGFAQPGWRSCRAGGNAIDAAVATGFALAVVYPQAGNLGGGGFMLIRMADGRTHFVDYREKAPAAATANMYLDAQGNVIENASLVGYKAIGVPGSVAGMVYAEKEYGKLTLGQVMAPAIKLARDGYPLAWEDARDLRDEDIWRNFPSRAAFFSATGITTSRARSSGSPSWRARWSGSRATPTTFITGRWRESWRPRCRRAED